MPDFSYANARLRAMRSNLLGPRDLERLCDSGSLSELIRRLGQTPYQNALEAAFLHPSELEMVLEGVRQQFGATLHKIRSFYPDEKPSILNLVLRGYDLHNLKSVLRGLAHHISPAEIRESLYPPGELSEVVLAELLPAGSPREAIDRLASLGHPFAAPLVALRASHPGADLFEMDTVLDQWRHAQARHELSSARRAAGKENGAKGSLRTTGMAHLIFEYPVLVEWLNLEADITNLLVVLRFLHNPGERQALSAHHTAPEIDQLLVATGRLPAGKLEELAGLKSVPAAIKALESASLDPRAPTEAHGSAPFGAWFGTLLASALPAYQRSGRLSALELALRRYQVNWQVAQIARDPLGPGVLLGYLALKAQECANLRRIASAIWRGAGADAIRAGLEGAAR